MVRMINDVDSKGVKDGILSFKNRKKNDKEADPDYFPHNATPLKDIRRSDLVNTEKSLTPNEG